MLHPFDTKGTPLSPGINLPVLPCAISGGVRAARAAAKAAAHKPTTPRRVAAGSGAITENSSNNSIFSTNHSQRLHACTHLSVKISTRQDNRGIA